MRALIQALSITCAMSAALWATAGHAQTNQNTTNAQQERMQTCTTEATSQNLAGQAKQDFMNDCLSGRSSTNSGASQQENKNLAACNRSASSNGLAGNARQQFMNDCLKRQ